MKFTTEDGKVYNFNGVYHAPKKGEYYLGRRHGNKVTLALGDHCSADSPSAIVELVRPEYTFGGVVFEETDEVRALNAGEWGLMQASEILPVFRTATCRNPGTAYQVLRPIRIIGKGA